MYTRLVSALQRLVYQGTTLDVYCCRRASVQYMADYDSIGGLCWNRFIFRFVSRFSSLTFITNSFTADHHPLEWGTAHLLSTIDPIFIPRLFSVNCNSNGRIHQNNPLIWWYLDLLQFDSLRYDVRIMCIVTDASHIGSSGYCEPHLFQHNKEAAVERNKICILDNAALININMI